MKKIFFVVMLLCSSTGDAQHTCGNDYFNSRKRLETIKKVFDALDFQPGDTIASIGASNGWFEAALSVYYDDLTFYLEDIDTACLNQRNFEAEIAVYSRLKKSRIQNHFILVAGTEKSTHLPRNTFKKILVNDVFHHFTDKPRMLQELSAICKPMEQLYVIEPIGAQTTKCDYYLTPAKLITEFESANFSLIEKTEVMAGTFLFRFKKK